MTHTIYDITDFLLLASEIKSFKSHLFLSSCISMEHNFWPFVCRLFEKLEWISDEVHAFCSW